MITEQIDYTFGRIHVFHSNSLEKSIDSIDYQFPYRIINVVALATFKLPENYKIDFDSIPSEIEFKRLNRFPCIMFKIDNVSCIFFKNGKVVLTGLKEQTQIPKLRIQLSKKIHELKIPIIGDINIEIQNLVAMTQLHRTMNLELSCLTLMNCIYEPEQFPAAIVKNPNGKGAFLIFSNSKIIILGMKDTESLEVALTELIKQIHEQDLFMDTDCELDMEDFDFDD